MGRAIANVTRLAVAAVELGGMRTLLIGAAAKDDALLG